MAVDQRDAGIAAHDAMTGSAQLEAQIRSERHDCLRERRPGSSSRARSSVTADPGPVRSYGVPCPGDRRFGDRQSPLDSLVQCLARRLLRTLQGRLRFCEREAHGRAGRRHVLGAVLGVAAVALAWMRDCPLGARRAPQPCRARPRTAGKHRCAGQRCGAPVRSGPAELWTTVGDVRVGWLGVDAPLRSVFLAAVHLVLRTRDGGERGGAGFPLRGCA